MNLPERPNVGQNLIVIHMAVTRGIDVTIEKSAAFAQAGDGTLRKGFGAYVAALVQVIDAHHLGEDEIAFPFLRPRLPGAPWDALHADHRAMLPLLEQMRAAGDEAATASGPAAALHRLGAAAQQLKRIWGPHMATEEQTLSASALARVFAPGEEEQLGGELSAHAQQHMPQPFLALPFVIYNLPPEPRAHFTATLPPVMMQQLVPQVWRDQWAPMKPFLLE